MTIYKYFDWRGVDVLRMLQLKVTPPDQYNDLSEFTPAAKGGLSNSDRERLNNEETTQEMYNELQTMGFAPDIESLKLLINQKVNGPDFGKSFKSIVNNLPSAALVRGKLAV